MAQARRKFDHDFLPGAVRLVRDTGKPIAQVARDLGVDEGPLGNWANANRRSRGDGTGALSQHEQALMLQVWRRSGWRGVVDGP